MFLKNFIKLILFVGVLIVAIELTLDEVLKSTSEEAITVTSFKTKEENVQFPELEMFLVSQDVIEGEVVETYQEYEVYYDGNGEMIKKEPTSNYDYIRYKQ